MPVQVWFRLTEGFHSAYAPQLATQLELSSTQLNIVGAAGNLGVYLSCTSSQLHSA